MMWDLLLTRWKLIVPIILISSMALAIYFYKSAYERSVLRLDVFKAEIATVTAVKEAENKALRNLAELLLTDSTKKYTSQLDKVKADYEKRNKTNIGTIVNLRNELRNKIATDSFTLPEATTNPNATAEEWRERHSAIVGRFETLKYACIITTADYNALRDWADIACLTVGCE